MPDPTSTGQPTRRAWRGRLTTRWAKPRSTVPSRSPGIRQAPVACRKPSRLPSHHGRLSRKSAANAMSLGRRLAAEAIGTALLLAAIIGSGIMGEQLAAGNTAVALLANTVATG